MKRNIISVALFVVLSTMAVSCQKENIVEPISTVSEISNARKVLYSIDGVEHTVILRGDEAWTNFIRSMMSLTEEGHSVRIANENASVRQHATKDTHIYTTKDPDDATAWTQKMLNDGYSVSVAYSNGVYTCIASK